MRAAFVAHPGGDLADRQLAVLDQRTGAQQAGVGEQVVRRHPENFAERAQEVRGRVARGIRQRAQVVRIEGCVEDAVAGRQQAGDDGAPMALAASVGAFHPVHRMRLCLACGQHQARQLPACLAVARVRREAQQGRDAMQHAAVHRQRRGQQQWRR